MTPITVTLMTYCPTPDQLYGNLLALRTLRTGFPQSPVILFDNNSCPECRGIFRQLAEQHGFQLNLIDTPDYQHHDFLLHVTQTLTGKVAIIDPDVVFWENCECFFDDMSADILSIKGNYWHGANTLFAGSEPVDISYIMPRLHTSFLCISNMELLRELVDVPDINVWEPLSNSCSGFNDIYDTGASLYCSFPQIHRPFTLTDLGHFDHLVQGTHEVKISDLAGFSEAHQSALTGNYDSIRGTGIRQYLEQKSTGVDIPYYALHDRPYYDTLMELHGKDLEDFNFVFRLSEAIKRYHGDDTTRISQLEIAIRDYLQQLQQIVDEVAQERQRQDNQYLKLDAMIAGRFKLTG